MGCGTQGCPQRILFHAHPAGIHPLRRSPKSIGRSPTSNVQSPKAGKRSPKPKVYRPKSGAVILHVSRFTFHVSRFTLLRSFTDLLRPGADEQADAGDLARGAAAAGLLATPAPALRNRLELGCRKGSLPGTKPGVERADFPDSTKRGRGQFAGGAVAGLSGVERAHFIRVLRTQNDLARQTRSHLSPPA